jgi:hypothetical protein
MKHKNIEFVIRAGLGRDEWIWTIYPEDAPAVAHQFSGTREQAEVAARHGIVRWLIARRRQDTRKLNPTS